MIGAVIDSSGMPQDKPPGFSLHRLQPLERFSTFFCANGTEKKGARGKPLTIRLSRPLNGLTSQHNRSPTASKPLRRSRHASCTHWKNKPVPPTNSHAHRADKSGGCRGAGSPSTRGGGERERGTRRGFRLSLHRPSCQTQQTPSQQSSRTCRQFADFPRQCVQFSQLRCGAND
ncbi:gll1078 [Gloeobacter violaceus PCC 7421]|uniref:Gll1078 protein n=1 Tax=Gloeobacter violaceus (strain ATCC 29082 / PCC 7421) TaxID=251221 RepID=Q7NLP3_GLOVI|nr:gll1078 [Gloeobacter violaceus PCC 7421]